MKNAVSPSLIPTAPEDAAYRSLHQAVWGLFFINGLLFATWAVRIPTFQEQLGLTPTQLALALLMITLGNFAIVAVIRRVVKLWGVRRTALLTVSLMCVALTLVGFAPSLPLAALCLFFYGCGFGGTDFVQNDIGAWLQEKLGRPIMSGLHGAFSVGTLAGALVGSALLQQGMTFNAHLLTLSTPSLALGGWLSLRLFMPRAAAASSAGHPVTPLLVMLLVAGFTAALCEGIVNDWSSVYLRSFSLDFAQASWGYVAFSLTMVLGRFSGDWLTGKFGPTRLAGMGMALALLGFVLVSFGGLPAWMFTGFALTGLGVSTLAPLSFSAAWGHAQARGIALMSAMFYGGFLSGPPLTGLIVERFTLSTTFFLPISLLLLCLLLVGRGIYAPPLGSTEASETDEATRKGPEESGAKTLSGVQT